MQKKLHIVLLSGMFNKDKKEMKFVYIFEKITPINEFDFKDLNNARQNNYAWSMAELDDYIYVGTGRNIAVLALQSIAPGIDLPSLLEPNPQDNTAEIWRYKKDGSLPWKRG